jgi:MerR family transcriptional regulator, light-induced transcriptional regulator
VTIGIGELARRTGLTQQVVRAWEARFGFPEPERTEGGRRAYDEADVDRIRKVLALKVSGVRLAEAIARVRGEATSGPQSIHAAVRRRHPNLEARVLRREPLVAISRAIEDEAMARVERPVVFGAFQREAFFRQSAARWGEIARTAAACLVFADFAEAGGGGRLPVEVPLAPDAPLLREWAVVVSAPTLSVMLTAWEIPDQSSVPADLRAFESTFTFDPEAVRTATEVCVSAARSSGVVPASVLSVLTDSLAVAPTPSHGIDSLVMRAFDYLQHAPRVGP